MDVAIGYVISAIIIGAATLGAAWWNHHTTEPIKKVVQGNGMGDVSQMLEKALVNQAMQQQHLEEIDAHLGRQDLATWRTAEKAEEAAAQASRALELVRALATVNQSRETK